MSVVVRADGTGGKHPGIDPFVVTVSFTMGASPQSSSPPEGALVRREFLTDDGSFGTRAAETN
jgi:hypothetical protein